MGRRRIATTDPATAVAYVRVSTAEQADSGLGLAAQRATVAAEAARRGLRLVEVFADEGLSGKSTENRPGLVAALTALDLGRAGVLLVAKLDRLSRSVADAAGLLDRAQRGGWALIAADLGVDTTTPAGEAMANVMATFAQLERKLIGQRTRDALAVKRAQGQRLGRPLILPAAVVTRIVREHQAGTSWSAIARGLEADAVPTAQGGARWYPATVRKVAAGQAAAALAG